MHNYHTSIFARGKQAGQVSRQKLSGVADYPVGLTGGVFLCVTSTNITAGCESFGHLASLITKLSSVHSWVIILMELK